MRLAFKLLFYATLALSMSVIVALVPLSATFPIKNRAGVWLYEQGHYKAAHGLFQTLSNYGHAEARNNLGVLVNLGLGTKQRFGEAFALYHSASGVGVVAARYNLARLYERGLGTIRDLEAAERLLSEAAELGDPFAQITLASLLERQKRPNWPQRKEALLRQAAEAGYAEAQYALGMLFYLGETASTEDQARRAGEVESLWEGAAKQGHGPAQASLAVIYQESDPAKALHWLRLAAENGEASAQLGLAQRLARGKGLEQNFKAAAQWFQKVAEAPEGRARPPRGWPELYAYHHPRVRPATWEAIQIARTSLAELHLAGQGVAKDPTRAAVLLQTAAEAGWGQAAVALAELFRKGEGVPQDLNQTLHWLRAAVEAGEAEALPRLQALQAELSQGAPDG